MRVNLFRPVHVKTLTSQKRRALLTARKLLQEKAIAVENDPRGLLPNFGAAASRVRRRAACIRRTGHAHRGFLPTYVSRSRGCSTRALRGSSRSCLIPASACHCRSRPRRRATRSISRSWTATARRHTAQRRLIGTGGPTSPQPGRLPPVPAPAKPLRASAHVAKLSLASHPNTYPGVHISLLQRSCTPSFG